MKKGFTLVELLAVIAILAILVIIALPNVMGMFNTAKQNSFNTEVKEVYKTAQQAWIMKNMTESASYVEYIRVNGKYYVWTGRGFIETTTQVLDLTGRDNLDFDIVFDSAGKVIYYASSDGTFWYQWTSRLNMYNEITDELKVEDITESVKWSEEEPSCQDYNYTVSNQTSFNFDLFPRVKAEKIARKCNNTEDFILNSAHRAIALD